MSDAPSERRFVAILFADISGFTRLSEHMDPEDVQGLVDALFTRLRAVLETQGGTLDKIIGDALMGVFGAPVAHGDDLARAARAALGLQREVSAFNAERGTALAIRAGVNAGEVLWGSVAGERATAMGDAVNVAQRLEAVAAPGTVLVSEAVGRALGRRFRLKGPETLKVKGREEGVVAYEAVAEEAEDRTEVVAGRAEAPLVGREAEAARLRHRLAAGPWGLVVVEGEAGSGKSVLLSDLRQAARSRRLAAWVATGRALEGQRLPLAPFADLVRAEAAAGMGGGGAGKVVELIRADLAGGDDVRTENRAHLVAISAGYEVPGARVAGMDPTRLRDQAHEAWEAWLRARAARGPVLLCLEDLHWADEATLALAAHLGARLAGDRVLLVASSRPPAPRLEGAETIALGGLAAADVAALAAAVVGRPVAPELVAFLSEQTGGNPFYVEELSAHLVSRGLLAGDPARLAAPAGGLPDGLHGLLTARIDALGAEEREALKAASVFGSVFWSGLLARVAGKDQAAPIAAAVRAQIVQRRSRSIFPDDPELQFRHALIREAAYALLPKRDRARLHAVAAGLLEERAATGGRSVLALAAAQRESAGDAAAAVRLWRRVAEEALGGGAPVEAVEAARSARRAGGGAAAGVLLARALVTVGRAEEALEASRAAAEAPGATPEESAHARLFEAQALHRLGRSAESLEIAARLASGAPTAFLRAAGEAAHVRALYRFGRHEEAIERGRHALAAFETVPAAERDANYARAVAGLKGNLGVALWGARRLEEAAAAVREVLDTFRALGDRSGEATSLLNLGAMCSEGRDSVEALSLHEQARGLAKSLGDHFVEGAALGNVASLLARTGDAAAAERTAREAIALQRETGDRAGEALSRVTVSTALKEQGRLEESIVEGRSAIRLAREAGYRRGLRLGLTNLSESLILAGDANEAVEALREACNLDAAIPSTAAIRAGLVGALLRAGRRAEAAVEAEALPRAAGWSESEEVCRLARARFLIESENPDAEAEADAARACSRHPDAVGAAAALAARAAALLGKDPAAARARLETAEGTPCTVLIGSLNRLEDLAEAALALNERSRARGHAEEGLRRALDSGAGPSARRFEELLRRASDPPPPARP